MLDARLHCPAAMSTCLSEVSGARASRVSFIPASVAVGERQILPLAAVGVGTPIALITVSALAYAAAFPPLSWSIAPWVALAPLLVVCATLSPLRAALAGMSWAVVAGLGVVWFLPAMLSRYFGLATAPSWLAAGAIVGGFHGVPVALYAAW